MFQLSTQGCLLTGTVLATLITITPLSFAIDFKQGETLIQLGGYGSHAGKEQFIYTRDIIGDRFTVSQQNNVNLLMGLGYFFDYPAKETLQYSYGINAFYLAKTYVEGDVIQENLFTNLAYKYGIAHIPIYALVKATKKNSANTYGITVDTGIGVNMLKTGNLYEMSLDGITLDDHALWGHTQATFSTTVGIGLKLNNTFGKIPLECGYRFFYLGQGTLRKTANEIINNFSTGETYANALLCSITI